MANLPIWFVSLLPGWWPANPAGNTTTVGTTMTGSASDDTLSDVANQVVTNYYGLGGDDYFSMVFLPGEVMAGGAGTDVYHLNYSPHGNSPNIVEAGGEGIDTVIANHQTWYGDTPSASGKDVLREFVLKENVENLVLGENQLNNTTGPAYRNVPSDYNRWGTGNALDNAIIGNDSGDNRLSGLDGNDHLMGNGGDDTVLGGNGTDTAYFRGNYSDYSITKFDGGTITVNDGVTARDGTDTLESVEILNFANLLYFLETNGPGGNDLFMTVAGPVIFDGGGGSDGVSYTISSAAVNIDLASGLSLGSASGHMFFSIENIFGSDTDGDIIRGDSGNNTLIGGGGNDLLEGRGGNDLIGGNAGNDLILGGDGNDGLDAGAGSDRVFGEAGNDTIVGDAGDDYLSGGTGNDFIRGGAEGDVLDGGQGDDTLVGEDGWDHLRGGSGNDVLDAGAGNDVLEGGSGNDVLSGEGGSDAMSGGSGADLFRFGVADGMTDTVLDFEIGIDQILLATAASVGNVLASAQTTDGGSTIIDIAAGVGPTTYVSLIGVTGINASWFVGGSPHIDPLANTPDIATDCGDGLAIDCGLLMPETCLIG